MMIPEEMDSRLSEMEERIENLVRLVNKEMEERIKILEGIVRDVALDEAWDYDKQECAYFICQAKKGEEHDSLCPHRRAKEYWEEHHGSKDEAEAGGAGA